MWLASKQIRRKALSLQTCQFYLITHYWMLEVLEWAPPLDASAATHCTYSAWEAGLDSQNGSLNNQLNTCEMQRRGLYNACCSLGLWASFCHSVSVSTHNQRNNCPCPAGWEMRLEYWNKQTAGLFLTLCLAETFLPCINNWKSLKLSCHRLAIDNVS